MMTGEPGLHARAAFPSAATFRALQHPHRRLAATRRSLAPLSQPALAVPSARKARARLTDSDPFVLAAPARDARGASAEQVVRIPITRQLRPLRSAVRAVPGADMPRFRV